MAPEFPTDIPILEKAAKDGPDDPIVYYALAMCYIAQENKTAMLTNIEKAYALAPNDPGICIGYALALKMNKQVAKAFEIQRQLASAQPNSPGIQCGLATLEMTIQKYDDAIAVLETLLGKAPPNLAPADKSLLHAMLGACYHFKGQPSKSIPLLEESLTENPKLIIALAALGEAYLKSNNIEKAGPILDQALAVNSNYAKALYYKGCFLEKMGDAKAAHDAYQDTYTKGKAYLSDNGEDYYLMYLVCQKLSKADEAQKYKTEAADLLFTYEAPWSQK